MTKIFGTLFNQSDMIQRQSLDHRLARSEVIGSNIANHETPGYLALEYSFEEALSNIAGNSQKLALKTSSNNHIKHAQLGPNDKIHGQVMVTPTESISEDGNSVDIDQQMTLLAENNILYKSVVETINRKLGILRYAISGGQ